MTGTFLPLVLRLALLLVATCIGQSANAQTLPVTISPPSFDLGSLFQNQYAIADFAIKNVSSGDVAATWSFRGGVQSEGFVCVEQEIANRVPFYLHPGETCNQQIYFGQSNAIPPPGVFGPGQAVIDYSINNGAATLSRTVTWNESPPPVEISSDPIDMGTAQVGQTVSRIVNIRNTSAIGIVIGVQLQQVQLTDCDPHTQPSLPSVPIPDPVCIKQVAEGGNALSMGVEGCSGVNPSLVGPNSTCTVSLGYTPRIPLPTNGDLLVYTGGYQITVPIKTAAAPVQTTAGTVLAVEYVNLDLQHYFVTAMQSEIDALDSGQFPPWLRTGRSFWVYPSGDPLIANESPVCRYFTTPTSGLSTHFYSAFPQECGAILTLFPGVWALETNDAFGVQQPDVATGACPSGTSPLYRLYNDQPNVNHRYVTDLDTRSLLIGSWIPEGYGPLGVGMCVPQWNGAGSVEALTQPYPR